MQKQIMIIHNAVSFVSSICFSATTTALCFSAHWVSMVPGRITFYRNNFPCIEIYGQQRAATVTRLMLIITASERAGRI